MHFFSLTEDNRNVIYGIVKDCYDEPVADAVVKLIEISCKCGKHERKPVSHTFTDKHGQFVFGPLCNNRMYEVEIWVNQVNHAKICATCNHEGNCLKGVDIDCDYPCHKPCECHKCDEYKPCKPCDEYKPCKPCDEHKPCDEYKPCKPCDEHKPCDEYKPCKPCDEHKPCDEYKPCKPCDEHKPCDEYKPCKPCDEHKPCKIKPCDEYKPCKPCNNHKPYDCK